MSRLCSVLLLAALLCSCSAPGPAPQKAAESAPAAPTPATVADLEGSSWTLAYWADGEPAAVEPPATLMFQEGRAAGVASCNNYSGQVKPGERPGDVSIGPVIGTRMACSPPQMEAESRYLKQLEATNAMTLMEGRLMLAYTLDGNSGTMTFDRAE